MATSYDKERETAARIVDKYVKRIAGIALKKGYNGFPYTLLEGKIVSGTDIVPYRVFLGNFLHEQFGIEVFASQEPRRRLSLIDLGTVFAKYVRKILDDIEEKVNLLPDVGYMIDSIGPETAQEALEYFKNNRQNRQVYDKTFGIMLRSGEGMLPIVGLSDDIDVLLSIPEEEWGRVISLVQQNSMHQLSPSSFNAFYILSSVLPFFKHRNLIESFERCNGEYSFVEKLDVGQRLMDEHARLKGCRTFEEALEKRFGKISLLTKEQQEQFVSNIKSTFNNMMLKKFDIYRGISLNTSGREDTNDWNDKIRRLISEMKKNRKHENTSKLIERILQGLGLFSKKAGTHVSEPWRYLDCELIVPLPAVLGGADARYGIPRPNRSTFRADKLGRLENLVREAIFYARFLDLADNGQDRAKDINGTAEAIIQGFVSVLDGIIEKMAEGRNSALVDIMRGERAKPRGVNKKTYSDDYWLKQLSSVIYELKQTIIGIFNQQEELLHPKSKEHIVSFKIESAELHARFATVRDNSLVYLDNGLIIYGQSETDPILEVPGSHFLKDDVLTSLKEALENNPQSELAFLLREYPSELIKSVKESFSEYINKVRNDLELQINQEKESFYKAFEENFPEDLFEDYCTGPAN